MKITKDGPMPYQSRFANDTMGTPENSFEGRTMSPTDARRNRDPAAAAHHAWDPADRAGCRGARRSARCRDAGVPSRSVLAQASRSVGARRGLVGHRRFARSHLGAAAPRTVPADQRGKAAPAVLEFDAAGGFIKAFGGPSDAYEWPDNEHAIFVDHKDRVWIGGNAPQGTVPPRSDDMLLTFTSGGKFIAQIGRRERSGGNKDTENLKRPADVFVDPRTNDAFVADGYGNRRVIVLDGETGRFKRMWALSVTRPSTRRRRRRVPRRARVLQRLRPAHRPGTRKAPGRRSSARSTRSSCHATASCTWPTATTAAFRSSQSTGSTSRRRSSIASKAER